ncbi:PLAC8-like protein 1 isoform X2 [Hyperolius riggenbachi]|uniref:PLAC8-like protein 1 isoform X2 n=1 Tax=Hyperolius riggenbachi TaxID=752182 RepID=UPI0035A364A8
MRRGEDLEMDSEVPAAKWPQRRIVLVRVICILLIKLIAAIITYFLVTRCCFAFWAFPCFQCATVRDHGECMCLPLLDTGCGGTVPVTIPPISLAMRASVRERYKIHGSIFNDCCMTCWCLSCSWCQMAREIKKRKVQPTIITAQTTTMMSPMPAGQPGMYPQYMQQCY